MSEKPKRDKYWRPSAIWKDETVFIIGGGPSLKKMELYPEFTPLHSRRVIGVNNAYTLGGWVDVCFFHDRPWFLLHNKDVVEGREGPHPGLKKFGGMLVTCQATCRGAPGVLVTLRRSRGYHYGLGYMGWNLSTGAAAINLAAYFGAKKIVLLGFDLRASDEGEGNWHKDNRLPAARMKFGAFIKGFKALKKGMDKHRPDIEVVNTSLDSALDIWPKVSLEEVLKNKPKTIVPKPVQPKLVEVKPVASKPVKPKPKVSPIPKIINFFWIESALPDFAKFLMAKWKKMNPDYEIKLHGAEVLRPEYKPIYKLLPTPSTRVDVLKFCALQTYGGWSIDTDTVPLRPMSTLTDKLDKDNKFVAINVPPADEKPGYERCDMGLIGATTDSRIWAAVNWYMAGNVDMAQWERRGTKGGACAMEWLLANVPHLMTRFPAWMYCPYGCKKSDRPWMRKGGVFWKAYRAGEDVTAMIAEYNAAFGNPPDDLPLAWHIWNRAIR